MARIDGTERDDSRFGTNNADTFYLKGGDDYAEGEGGDDVMHGGDGRDTLHGVGGDDTLYGEGGSDMLIGDAGRDVLIGGAGGDSLYGKGGGDIFRYTSLDQSGPNNRDAIVDFNRSEDLIDLQAIDANHNRAGNQSFDYIGDHAFTGHAGELRYQYYAQIGDGLLEGDVNGDGRADFSIQLHGVQMLGYSDILL